MKVKTKEIVSHDPYFKRIQKDYLEKIETPYLEEKKKKLKEVRSMRSQPTPDEMAEYRNKLDEQV
jgi:hypothetical protein